MIFAKRKRLKNHFVLGFVPALTNLSNPLLKKWRNWRMERLWLSKETNLSLLRVSGYYGWYAAGISQN